MNSAIYNTITDVLIQKFQADPAKIQPDTPLQDLGLDSLSLMEFVFALEDAFNLRIPEDKLDPRQGGLTLSHLSAIIQDHLPGQAATAAS